MNKFTIKLTMIIFLSSFLYANCNKKINVSTVTDTSLIEVVQQISNICQISMFIADDLTAKALSRTFKTLYFKNISFDDAIKTLLDRDFYYDLTQNKLEIAYLDTAILKLNYIALRRTSKSSTKLTLDSSPASGSNDSGGSQGSSEVSVNVTNEFNFWDDLRNNINSILIQDEIIGLGAKLENLARNHLVIDEKTGLIYIKSSKRQLAEVEKFIESLNKNISKQVLVDINIYQVQLNDIHKTGIDWSQISDLQNIGLGANIGINLSTAVDSVPADNSIRFAKDVSIDNILAFISNYGKTDSISNPRVLAINNQTAIISVGKQIYHKIKQVTTVSRDTVTQSENEEIDSIFAGIVVDITPAISEDNEIILKINNSITRVINDNKNKTSSNNLTLRTIPPDIEKQEISTVVKAQDGEKIILGGLISNSKLEGNTGIRGLTSIPIIGRFFGTKSTSSAKDELVIVITPKVF